MSGRRSGRMPAVSSPLALLDQVAPAHRALNAAKAGVLIGSPHYAALERATDALGRLAADLGHEGRLSTPGHATPGPRG